MKSISWRWLIRVLVFLSMSIAIFDAFRRASYVTHWSGMTVPYLMLIMCYIIPAAWIGWHLTQILGERVSRLYWPRETVIPPPLYYLIELHLKRGDLDKALFEYEKILHYHPEELQAHLGRLELMAAIQSSSQQIEKVYLKSFKALKAEEDRIALNAHYSRRLSGPSPSQASL